MGIRTSDEPLVGLELATRSVGESQAGKTLADTGQADHEAHGGLALFGEPDQNLIALDPRANENRRIGLTGADLHTSGCAHLDEPRVDLHLGVASHLGDHRVVEPLLGRFFDE